MSKRKVVTLALAVLTAVSLAVGTLAYLTDRIEVNLAPRAGTVDLDIANFELNGVAAATGVSGLTPGQGVEITYDVLNEGNKAVDVKETLILTVLDDSAAAKNLTVATPEFKLYSSGVTIDTANGNVATVSPGAVQVGTLSGNKITYTPDAFSLDGKTLDVNSLPIGTGELGGGDISASKTLYLVFDSSVSNDFVGAQVTLDYMAEAKQHANTDDSTWAAARTGSVTFAGTPDTSVVPARS